MAAICCCCFIVLRRRGGRDGPARENEGFASDASPFVVKIHERDDVRCERSRGHIEAHGGPRGRHPGKEADRHRRCVYSNVFEPDAGREGAARRRRECQPGQVGQLVGLLQDHLRAVDRPVHQVLDDPRDR